jgi:hypothetical protein
VLAAVGVKASSDPSSRLFKFCMTIGGAALAVGLICVLIGFYQTYRNSG